jgi:hypothetical protein
MLGDAGMITAKCPLCNAGLTVVFKNEKFAGWKQCVGCKHPSFVSVRSDGKYEVKSLRGLIESATKFRRSAPQTLSYIMRQGEAYHDDVVFTVGKSAAFDLEEFSMNHLLVRKGNHYSLAPSMEQPVKQEIAKYLPEKRDWAAELISG